MKKAKKEHSRIARFSVLLFNRAKTSVAIWMSLFLFGFFSYTVFMQRQGFPQVDVPVSFIQGVYFVDDKAQVDEQVTKPVIDAISNVSDVKSTTANTGDNQTTIVIEYNEGVSSQQGSDAVEAEVNKIQLPAQAQLVFKAVDATRYNNKYDILLSVSSSQAGTGDLLGRADEVANALKEKLPDATLIEAVDPFEEGLNPQTGQTVRRQTSFDWYGTKENGEVKINQSVIVGITLKSDEDIIGFDDHLKDALQSIDGQFEDVNINVAASFAPSIREQISSLQGNLFEGLVIVILVCMIFIGWRAGIMAALGLMVTLTTTVGILYLFGISLNTISLFALVLCLGLVVDDTIIVIEAIDAQNSKSKSLREAVLTSIDKVALASAAGTFTTVLGFAPLLFISGILGEFIRLLPITIITALIVSLITSLLFIPFLSRWFFEDGKTTNSHKGVFKFVRVFETWLGDTLGGFIESANGRRKKLTRSVVAVAISLAFIIAAVPVFGQLKFDIFPTAKDSNDLQVELTFAPQTTIDQAKTITDSANRQIENTVGENLQSITYIGSANSRQAVAHITLVPYQEREETAKSIVNDLDNNLNQDNTRIVVSQVGAGPPKEQFPFKVQIPADDPAQANTVANNLVGFLDGREIKRQNGTTSNINEVEYTGEQASITRIDGKRIVQVSANFTDDDVSALVQATQKEIEDEFLSSAENLAGINKDDIHFDFGSESDNQKSFESAIIAFPILVFAMYLLLAVQFRSFFQPLLILIAVPFSFFGVAVALRLTDNPLSFFVMVAFFALIGISVNNSILLTDYANQNRRKGMSPRYAMADALRQRTRPLMTTSITSVLALAPLALSDPFWESLAFTLIGGLTASAILVLVSFPYYYLGLEALRSRAKQKWQSRKS